MKSIVYYVSISLPFIACNALAIESSCYGTSKKGRLEHGVKLPSSGVNFKSYGKVPELLGRTYVHSRVKKVVVQAYMALGKSLPNSRFKYAETGFEKGGKYAPHKTHQNGLSVDFMVPVVDKNGRSVYFPTNIGNKYGYRVHFDSNGKSKKYEIDFDSLAAHIVVLHKAARNNGITLRRVIFAPDLQKYLYATKYGRYIKANIYIPTKKSWVRHDEHIHVDFKINCKPL